MGITIHYRGTIDRLGLIEEFEDRVIDLAFAMGGQATVWRSYADHDSLRVIRGLLLEMTPGQETMSLLISPEGHLINLFEIEEAEKLPTTEPSWCFVKTQFGSLVGHVSVVYLLDALKAKYFSNIEVHDEGGFSDHRDPIQLASKLKQLGNAIGIMADSLRDHGLSEEAAEDPAILIARIERIAQLMAKKLYAPVPKPLARCDRATVEFLQEEPSLEDQVDEQMQDYRRRFSRSERILRRMREQEAIGDSINDAYEKALQDEGLGSHRHKNEDGVGTTRQFDDESLEESWEESFEDMDFVEQVDEETRNIVEHPAVICAENCLTELAMMGDKAAKQSAFYRIATDGLLNVMGGLVQATSLPQSERGDRAYAIVQLRRALKGLAYFRGAIFGLRVDGWIDVEAAESFHRDHHFLLESTHGLLGQAWDESN